MTDEDTAQTSPLPPDDGLPPVPRRSGREALPPPEPVVGPTGAPAKRGPGVGRVLAIVLLLLVAVAFVVSGGGWWYLYGRPARVAAGKAVTVTVKSGDSVPTIASQLEKAGVVRTALGFELFVRALGTGDTFQAGTYRFKTGMSGEEVIAALEEGHAADAIVVATPVFFASVPSTLKALYDRCQPYWARRYVLGEPRPEHKRPGALLIAAGGGDPYGHGCVEAPTRSVFAVLGVELTDVVVAEPVDAARDVLAKPEVIEMCGALGERLGGPGARK